jgi:hypothetical protein
MGLLIYLHILIMYKFKIGILQQIVKNAYHIKYIKHRCTIDYYNNINDIYF